MVREPLASLEGGAGEPLLLLHSGLCTCREWRGVVDRLSGSFEVLAPTLPGSLDGPSLRLRRRSLLAAMADHVEELLDARGWRAPVSIAGSSFGGVIGIELAARARARNVIALAPPWLGVKTGLAYGIVLAPVQAWLRATDALLPVSARWRSFGALWLHSSLRPALLDASDTIDTLRSVSRFPLWRVGLERAAPAGMLPTFENVRVPVLLVWGTRDALAPIWMARLWRDAIPDAELVTLPGFPHVPQLRDPGRIADLIAEASTRPSLSTEIEGAAA
jgi:pimeloyl-ACP methyl ester carboxylesterase